MNFHIAKVVIWATVLPAAANWLLLRAVLWCFSSLSGSEFGNGSTEIRSAAVGSTVAHFTTLGAQKFMNRATRICINFCSSSNYVATRARGKWLTLGAKYRVFWAVSSAKFWVGPRKPDFQPYEAP